MFTKRLIYALLALAWHRGEGKDVLPNVRSHVREVVKGARGVGDEGARYFRRRWL